MKLLVCALEQCCKLKILLYNFFQGNLGKPLGQWAMLNFPDNELISSLLPPILELIVEMALFLS